MTLRVGLVGAGKLAATLAGAASRVPGVDLCAVAAPNSAAGFAEQHGIPQHFKDYRTLLEAVEVDAIAIAAPTDLHFDIALAACDGGKHVICLPPLASTFAEAELMLHAMRRADTTLFYADPAILSPSAARLLDLVTTGLIGEPSIVRIRTAHTTSGAVWARDIDRAGGGVMMQLGASGILLAARAFTAWPEAVLAQATVGAGGMDESAVLILDFGGGRRAIIDVDCTAPLAADRIEVQGSAGSIVANRLAGTMRAVHHARAAADGHTNAESEQHWPFDAVRDSGAAQVWQHLGDVLAGRARLAAGLEDGLNVLEAIYAAYASAASGQRTPVATPELGEFAPGYALESEAVPGTLPEGF